LVPIVVRQVEVDKGNEQRDKGRKGCVDWKLFKFYKFINTTTALENERKTGREKDMRGTEDK